MSKLKVEQVNTLNFNELAFKIIALVWYPINYYKLSFGKQDQLSKYVLRVKTEFGIQDDIKETELIQFLNESSELPLIRQIVEKITRYVPYRFVRPWFPDSRALNDAKVNQYILNHQQIIKDIPPYCINQQNKYIKFNKDWFDWILNYYSFIESFTLYNLVLYLEKNNPTVPALPSKLFKPETRKLTHAIKLWNNYISENKHEMDLFENKKMINFERLSIDHFLPWSFVTHDLLWNLHPVEHFINSSKGNKLPKKEYLNGFFRLQYKFSKFLLKINYRKQLEQYLILFKIGQPVFESMTESHFIKGMEKIYNPQFETASNMGFETGWKYNSC